MGVFYERIPENLASWIVEQHLFWVATAPLSGDGHVNVSPKGGAYFGLLDASTFWYMDLSGSGNETIAHLRENGRITVSFSAFVGAPKIVRLWGKGRVMERDTAGYDAFVAKHDVLPLPATRSIIVVDVHQVGSSCGYSVPFLEFKGHRDTLLNFFEKKARSFQAGKAADSMPRYWAYKNAWSIDGLPGMQKGLDCAERDQVAPLVKMVGPLAPPAPFGPKSAKYLAQLKYRIAMLRTAKVDMLSVFMFVAIALVIGVVIGLYGPVVAESQRIHLQRLLL